MRVDVDALDTRTYLMLLVEITIQFILSLSLSFSDNFTSSTMMMTTGQT